MAARTTRSKIKHQAHQINMHIKKIYEHLKFMEELASGRSDYIESKLPIMTVLTKQYEDVLQKFFQDL